MELIVNGKPQGVVSFEDADLARYNWKCAVRAVGLRRSTHFSGSRKSKNITLTRVIMARVLGRALRKDEVVIHKNRDILDNRRENLCIGKHSCVRRRQPKMRGVYSSIYKGVYFDKKRRRWEATVNSSHTLKGGASTFAPLSILIPSGQIGFMWNFRFDLHSVRFMPQSQAIPSQKIIG